MSNHISREAWDRIINPFPNFNACTVEVWEWKRMFQQPWSAYSANAEDGEIMIIIEVEFFA